jgi:hypothetical protein
MSRGLKIGDVYQDQEGEARRAAIIVSVAADGTQARLEYLDGRGDFPATQDALVSWTVIGSLAYGGDPAPWRVAKTGNDRHLLWETYAPDEKQARLIAGQAMKDGTAAIVVEQARDRID